MGQRIKFAHLHKRIEIVYTDVGSLHSLTNHPVCGKIKGKK